MKIRRVSLAFDWTYACIISRIATLQPRSISNRARASINLWQVYYKVGDSTSKYFLLASLNAWTTILDFSYSIIVPLPLTLLTSLDPKIRCSTSSLESGLITSKTLRTSNPLISCCLDQANRSPGYYIIPLARKSSDN